MIKARNITKTYGNLEVLKGIDLVVAEGEMVSIVGASGAGKSTLLQIIGTIDRPSAGELSIDGTQLSSMPKNELAKFRNERIGFVFQFHHLLPEFTALENVCIPAFIGGTGRSEASKRAAELLKMLGLSERLTHKPAELSGGEQQRVAVARALMNKPAVLLADEPTGNLDSGNSEDLRDLFVRLKKDLNQTLVVVTHDEELANVADRKLQIDDGFIIN